MKRKPVDLDRLLWNVENRAQIIRQLIVTDTLDAYKWITHLETSQTEIARAIHELKTVNARVRASWRRQMRRCGYYCESCQLYSKTHEHYSYCPTLKKADAPAPARVIPALPPRCHECGSVVIPRNPGDPPVTDPQPPNGYYCHVCGAPRPEVPEDEDVDEPPDAGKVGNDGTCECGDPTCAGCDRG